MKYCIYTHALDGKVFYVGCCKLKLKAPGFKERHTRVFERSKRSRFWKGYVGARKIDISILSYHETQEDAYAEETKWITHFGRIDLGTGTLVNRAAGGASVPDGPFVRAVPIIQCDLQGNAIREWISARYIETELGILKTNVVRCCRKRQITAYGFKWKYKYDPFENIQPKAGRYTRLIANRSELPMQNIKNIFHQD